MPCQKEAHWPLLSRLFRRYLHDPRMGDGAGLVEAVEGWLEDSYLLSHEALDTIEKCEEIAPTFHCVSRDLAT